MPTWMARAIGSRASRTFAVVMMVHIAHSGLRGVASALARREGVGSIAVSVLVLVVTSLFLGLAVRWFRQPPSLHIGWLVAIVLATFVPRYAVQLSRAKVEGDPLPSIGLHAPMTSDVERSPGRPRVTYHYNDRGFRGPRWPDRGTRLCAIGDSFVFGSGVEWEDTLGERLRAELPDVVVLNLGVPGHNLGSHVALVEHAASLGCDAIVLSLTIPNDLASWDINTELAQRWTVSSYSLAELVLGPEVPALVFNTRELPTRIGPDELAVLRDGWAELPMRPPVLVFAYFQSTVVEALPPRANVLVVPSPAYDEASFIPGDGHPTGRGNAGFARLIAAALRGDARFAVLFE